MIEVRVEAVRRAVLAEIESEIILGRYKEKKDVIDLSRLTRMHRTRSLIFPRAPVSDPTVSITFFDIAISMRILDAGLRESPFDSSSLRGAQRDLQYICLRDTFEPRIYFVVKFKREFGRGNIKEIMNRSH